MYCLEHDFLTLNILHHTIPHQLCGCEVKDVHGLQSFVLTHSEESDSMLFTLCAITNAFNNRIQYFFFRGVGLGVCTVHHHHQGVKVLLFAILVYFCDYNILSSYFSFSRNRLIGQVVKASASRAEGPGFKSRLRQDFFGVESYQ